MEVNAVFFKCLSQKTSVTLEMFFPPKTTSEGTIQSSFTGHLENDVGI